MTPSALADFPPLQWLAAHWEPLLAAAVLAVTGVLVFRSALAVYGRIFFPARALRNAFLKALVMVGLFFAIFALPHWLFRALLPAGWLQNLSILVSFVLFDAMWGGAGRLLDRLFIGR